MFVGHLCECVVFLPHKERCMKHVKSSPRTCHKTGKYCICEVIGLFEPVDKPLTVSDAEGVRVLDINNRIIIRLERGGVAVKRKRR